MGEEKGMKEGQRMTERGTRGRGGMGTWRGAPSKGKRRHGHEEKGCQGTKAECTSRDGEIIGR